jgi:hypothetical protein
MERLLQIATSSGPFTEETIRVSLSPMGFWILPSFFCKAAQQTSAKIVPRERLYLRGRHEKISRTIRMLCSLLALVVAGTISCKSQDLATSNTRQFSTITVRTRCEAMRPERCPGFYGFSVASDGKFKVGPDPKENVIEGSVSGDELATLASAVNAQLASGTKMTCLDIRILGGTKVITATFTDGTRASLLTAGLVPGSEGGKCALGDLQKAKLVDDVVGKLLARYYPQPFPAP